jgi:hypothetical protein
MTRFQDANAREHAAEPGVTAGGGRRLSVLSTPHGQEYVSLLVKPIGRCWLRRGRDDAQ